MGYWLRKKGLCALEEQEELKIEGIAILLVTCLRSTKEFSCKPQSTIIST